MKKIVVILVSLIFASISLFSQQATVDVVYLKNGNIIRCQVMEVGQESVKIKTADNSIYIYSMTEVIKIVKEPVTSSEPVERTKSAAQPVPPPKPKQEGVSFGFVGGIFANLEGWNKLKGEPDHKFGFGLMGTIAGGIRIDDDMYIGLGPHLGVNMWSQSKTVANTEVSASLDVADFGGNFVFVFDDMFFILGMGSANVSATAKAGGSTQTVTIPESAPFTRVMFGWGDGLAFGCSYVSYSDWAEYLSRFEINLGYTF
jgi:hypothetical protein